MNFTFLAFSAKCFPHTHKGATYFYDKSHIRDWITQTLNRCITFPQKKFQNEILEDIKIYHIGLHRWYHVDGILLM